MVTRCYSMCMWSLEFCVVFMCVNNYSLAYILIFFVLAPFIKGHNLTIKCHFVYPPLLNRNRKKRNIKIENLSKKVCCTI